VTHRPRGCLVISWLEELDPFTLAEQLVALAKDRGDGRGFSNHYKIILQDVVPK
jgi:hypothetical protein